MTRVESSGYGCYPIKEMEAPMVKALKELEPIIEKSEYGLIIGDDISGRVPTLVVREYINRVSNRRAKRSIPTVFLQDHLAENVESLDDQFSKRVLPFMESRKRKALYVSEFVCVGRKLSRILDLFAQHDIDFDLFIMHLAADGPQGTDGSALDDLDIPKETNILIGDYAGLPALHHTVFAGLYIDHIGDGLRHESLKSCPPVNTWKRKLQVYGKNYPDFREMIAQARQDVHLLTDKAVRETSVQLAFFEL